jgi:uncharacterized protein with HEPN domain
MNNKRDTDVLSRIVQYCAEIAKTRERFGDSLEALQLDTAYKNAVAMCVLQIGELTAHLSDDFKTAYANMPWQDIRGMRNIAAHHYGRFDVKKLWETIVDDIPAMKAYIEEILRQNSIMDRTNVEELDGDSE